MAYKEITRMDVYGVLRRWHDRQSTSEIARATGYDRKTVRSHIRLATLQGLFLESLLPPKEEVLALLAATAGKVRLGRASTAQALFTPFLDEITGLVNHPKLAVTPKTAYRMICDRHELTGLVSYTSYKRFVRTHVAQIHPKHATCRIELPPGEEAQLDYARIALHFDRSEGRSRTLFAFIGTLSHSRLKYVELTYTQDQTSFVGSNVRMLEFYEGGVKRIVIDNLKSGVIRPDLYDPRFNLCYQEMSERYHIFIDPARVARGPDKGKVERDVQTVRDAVRMILHDHADEDLAALNRLIRDWCLHEYGTHIHGTTGERPLQAYVERERPALRPLPAERFVPSIWKQAVVHPDHFVQYLGKTFNVPTRFIGQTVWIKVMERLLQVLVGGEVVAQHVITKNKRHINWEHFPENVRAVLDTSTTHRRLLDGARAVGPAFGELILGLLEEHAYLNLRPAQGLLHEARRVKGKEALVERAARFMTEHRMKAVPKNLRILLEKLQAEEETCQRPLPVSEATRAFLRDASYFAAPEDTTTPTTPPEEKQ